MFVKNVSAKVNGEVRFSYAPLYSAQASADVAPLQDMYEVRSFSGDYVSARGTEQSSPETIAPQLFGRFGGIRQIRMGSEKETKGTAFVVSPHQLIALLLLCRSKAHYHTEL